MRPATKENGALVEGGPPGRTPGVAHDPLHKLARSPSFIFLMLNALFYCMV